MKPRWQVNERNKRSDSFFRHLAPYSPATDCNYQQVVFGSYNGGHAGSSKGSFLTISRDYFRSEARWSYLAEALFFTLIIATTAGALIYGVGVIIHALGLPTAA
jgi:hypothetical protein